MPDRPVVPDFAVALRGYDRHQVDEYIHRLTMDLDEAHGRALEAERRALATPGATASFADLGPHIASVLERATTEADQLRRDAEAYAEAVRAEADQAAMDTRTLSENETAAAAWEREALLVETRQRANELLERSVRHADQRAEEILRDAGQQQALMRSDIAHLQEARAEADNDVRRIAHRLLAGLDEQAPRSASRRIDLRDPAEVSL